ncbi:MAG TPA: MFS transporter [Terriglobales bacterium]|jgi:SHS family lactate transporter-like MFS transporter|nr:MFS transporter [Terriglobales bacterium]
MPDPPRSGHAVAAGFLGWTLDAFDFFIVTFLFDKLAAQFHVQKGAIIATVGATLAMRPLGALLFGLLADRYGRRLPLMANVIYFAVIEVLCGFATNYPTFLILRILFGIGMGGEWGVGSSLAMESAPPRWRGIFSGIVQSGYSLGNLLAATAALLVLPHWGWRAMFWVGGAPALLALYIRMKVPESQAWQQHRAHSVGAILRTVAGHWKSFVYLVLLMTLMVFLSHGTQDLYPDFLKIEHKFAASTVSYIAMFYNVGAILGSVTFGHLSERLGRRYSMAASLGLSLAVIPLWAFSSGVYRLALGAFLMQVGVQGAWGIIPAHINELAPDSARGLVPGLAYQLGILLASPVNTIEHHLYQHVGYQWALGGFELANILLLATVVLLGKERKGRDFMREQALPSHSPTA